METYNRIEKAFPFEDNQAAVVVEGDEREGRQTAKAIAELKREALASGQMHETSRPRYSKDKTVAA